jgi:hypothetical protein
LGAWGCEEAWGWWGWRLFLLMGVGVGGVCQK